MSCVQSACAIGLLELKQTTTLMADQTAKKKRQRQSKFFLRRNRRASSKGSRLMAHDSVVSQFGTDERERERDIWAHIAFSCRSRSRTVSYVRDTWKHLKSVFAFAE